MPRRGKRFLDPAAKVVWIVEDRATEFPMRRVAAADNTALCQRARGAPHPEMFIEKV